MKDTGIVVRKKDPQQVNSIAAVDRAMQSVKSILKNVQGDGGLAKGIKRASSLYNDREHSALYGASRMMSLMEQTKCSSTNLKRRRVGR